DGGERDDGPPPERDGDGGDEAGEGQEQQGGGEGAHDAPPVWSISRRRAARFSRAMTATGSSGARCLPTGRVSGHSSSHSPISRSSHSWYGSPACLPRPCSATSWRARSSASDTGRAGRGRPSAMSRRPYGSGSTRSRHVESCSDTG